MFTSKLKPFLFLRRLIAIVWSAAPGQTAAKGALLAMEALLPILTIYLTKLAVDEITAAAQTPSPQFSGVMWLLAALAAVSATAMIAQSVAHFFDEKLELAVTNRVLALLYTQSIAIDLAHYENPAFHDTLHRAQREAMYRPGDIIRSVANVLQQTLTLVSLTILLLTMNWIVAVVLVLSTIPSLLVRLFFSQRFYALDRENTCMERENWYFHFLLTVEHYAKEVRLFGLGKMFMERCLDLREKLFGARINLMRKRSTVELLAAAPGGIALLVLAIYLANQAVYGIITLGVLVMYYQAFQQGQTNLRAISHGVVHLYESSLFLENLFEFFDLKPCIAEKPEALPVPPTLVHGIVFEDVHFTYADRPVLKGVSLTIKPGEHIALVGSNGAGKTTLIKLLSRLHDPSSGRILLDGVDLREMKLSELRRAIGVIFQDHVKYNLTARENIWVGNTALELMHEGIPQAAGAATAAPVIEKLPSGYESRLGNWFEKGQDLSGGEWQKIALARAFFRDAQILVLDEPTSALDAPTEYEVFSKFHELAAGRTTILISHRFSTVRMAHRIYVLADGCITEAGSHDELMALGGEYARMYELQARNYR
jgi:ATP-binding cassette subfamily B protein